MNILVCIKQVPDTTEIKMDPVTNTLIRSGVESVVNPFDKNAIEAAVQLKEKHGGTVTAITMGPMQAAAALRECYALGADRIVLVSDPKFGGSDTFATSSVLAAAVRALGGFDLIICGKQAIDGDTAQVGPEIAEHLGIPQLTYACEIEIINNNVRVRREQETYYELVEAPMPALVTVVKSINEPRLPNVMRKLQINRSEPELISAKDLPELDLAWVGLKGSPTKVAKTFVPVRSKDTVMIDAEDIGAAVSELISRLEMPGANI